MDLTFGPQGSDFHADPHPVLHALRMHDPVHFIEMPGLWFLTIIGRLPALQLEGAAIEWRKGIMMRGLKTLPLSFSTPR